MTSRLLLGSRGLLRGWLAGGSSSASAGGSGRRAMAAVAAGGGGSKPVVRGIVFDMDGTLTVSLGGCCRPLQLQAHLHTV